MGGAGDRDQAVGLAGLGGEGGSELVSARFRGQDPVQPFFWDCAREEGETERGHNNK